jgi:regulation of enolase protein 1 (concanavalin A-like superfamily)
MRVFHLHYLGETTPEMGRADPPVDTGAPCSFGFYACSPLESTFTTRFSDFSLGPCTWRSHAE